MFWIGFITGVVLMVLIIKLVNIVIRYRIKQGDKLIGVGEKLIADKIRLQTQLNELSNGR